MSYQTVSNPEFMMFLAVLLRARISESDGKQRRTRYWSTGRIK
jgi:hypothetical protein